MNPKVGRVSPCSPQFATDVPDGAPGVTHPTNTLAAHSL